MTREQYLLGIIDECEKKIDALQAMIDSLVDQNKRCAEVNNHLWYVMEKNRNIRELINAGGNKANG